MQQPSIDLFGILIAEPVTTLTDLLVSLVCFYAFHQLGQLQRKGRIHTFFRYYFLLMGISTLLGGILGHAFQHTLGHSWKLPGWLVSMFSISLLERTSIFHAKPLLHPTLAKVYQVANLIELAFFFFVVIYTQNFKYIEIHTAFGLIAVSFTLNLFVWWHTKSEGSLYILLAILVTGMASFFFTTQFSLSPWFNYLDISHVFMALGAWVFYIAAQKLEVLSNKQLSASN